MCIRDRWWTEQVTFLPFPEISCLFLYKIVSEKLNCQQLCANWVPKMLMKQHTMKQWDSAFAFLTWFRQQGDDFLICIVIGGMGHECLMQALNQNSNPWHRGTLHSLQRNSASQRFPLEKILCTVFGDRKGVFIWKCSTINCDVYCKTLTKLCRFMTIPGHTISLQHNIS